MTDSYLVSMNDPETFKVGEKAIFKGEAGLKVGSIELVVDGFPIGRAGFGRSSGDRKLWELEYTFNGAGKSRILMLIVTDSIGTVIQTRKQFINVEPAIKIEPKPEINLKLVTSAVTHVTRGPMDCVGLVVHYTATNMKSKASDVIRMASDGNHPAYAYWVLDYDGTIYKTHELNRWGYHCGAYEYHSKMLGLEIMCAGKLVEKDGKLYPWYNIKKGVVIGPEFPRDKARWFEGSKTQIPGWYIPYTEAQEKSLFALVQYLKDNCKNFKIDNVLGHDEIMTAKGWRGEKQDPGGSLSMDMPTFREYLKKVIV
jgi:N-acetyl-anhydromuramyl-L-alanine amidase AmpD